VAASTIFTRDVGLAQSLVPHHAGVSEPQNRYVQLVPMGMWSEHRRKAVEECKLWVQENCFRSLKIGQQVLCAHALNIIALP
jgi:hypothetical protein